MKPTRSSGVTFKRHIPTDRQRLRKFRIYMINAALQLDAYRNDGAEYIR